MPLRTNMEPQEFLEIFSRKKWLIVFTILLIMFGASIYCVVIPDQYKSSATILVIPPSVSESYVRSSVNYSVEARIASIHHQVLSRTRMIAVIEELGLFREERKSAPAEAFVQKMQDQIEINVVRGKNAFTLSFLYENPNMAQLTTSKLVSFFIEENQRAREQTAVGTTEFLDSQLAETKVKLEEQEEKVKRYKLQYMGELPQQMEVNLSLLSRLQEQEKSTTEAIAKAEDRKLFLESEIAKLQRQGVVLKDPVDSLMEALAEKQKKLHDLSAMYTENYPTLIQLRREIEQLEDQIVSLQGAELPEDAGMTGKGSAGRPTVQRGRRDNEDIRRLREQVARLILEIKALRREKEESRRTMHTVESKVGRLPQREQEMISLTRDYENLKRSYDELLKKKLEAGISQNLEEEQKGEKFQILDPANLPMVPFKPDRRKVLSIAFLGALAIGFGGVLVLEFVDPTLRGTKDFKYFFQMPILAAIPIIRDGEYSRKKTVRRKMFLAGLVSLASAVTVFLLVYQDKIRAILRISGGSE